MPNPMLASQWPRFLLPLIRKEWLAGMGTAPAAPSFQFFNVQTSTHSVEYSQGIGEVGLVPEYNSASAEGKATIEYDSFSALYESTFTHKEFALGISIERKLWDDDQQGLIRRRATSLGDTFGVTRSYHAASLFNNAFSASYVGGDLVALCSDSHPVNKDSSSTYDNAGTTPLSYSAVIATIKAGNAMTNDRSLPRPIMYDTIMVPSALQDIAFEVTKSVLKPGTADNNANFLNGKGLNIVIDPYLTDTNNWFMIDSAQAKQHLLWFNRVLPEITIDPASDYNLVAKYRGYMRYSFGWDDARWIYGHLVS
jgi:phage major head subunit gpT-like protein